MQPLGQAAMYGQTACAKYLVEAGADCKYRDFQGNSAADRAGMNGHMECQKYLWSVISHSDDKQQFTETAPPGQKSEA